MRLGKIVLIGLSAIVLIVVAGVVILLNLDFNEYKEQIAAEAKKVTGRELKIGGDLKLNLFTLSPGLAVNDVRFANAPWGSRPDMARFDRFEVKVAVPPLLGGKLVVKRLVLTGADILIERNKAGRGNYEFTVAPAPGKKTPAAKQPAEKQKKASDGAAPGELPSVGVNEVLIDKALLTYRDAASGQKVVLGVKRMRLRGGTDEPLEMEIDGDFNKAPFRIDGRFGPIAQLLKGRKPWPLSVDVKAGGAAVALKGTVAEPLKAANLNVKFSVSGKDLSGLSGFAGAPVPPLGPYALSGRLKGRPDTAVTISGLSVKMGKSALSGGVKVNLKGRPAATVTLKSDFLDLADFVKPADGSAKKKGAAKKAKRPAAKSKKKSKRLFPSDPLPLDGLRAADVALDLKVKKLLAQGVKLSNLTVKLGLRDGDLSIKPLAVGVAKGTINSQIRLNARQATPRLSVKLSGKKIAIGQLLAQLGITDLVIGTINTDVDLNGSGKSVRKLMAGLNGKTSIVMGKGRMKSDALDSAVGGAAKAVTQLVFGKKSEYTVINCFVNQFDMKNGVAKSRITVFDTEYARIVATGNINLGTERIAMNVDPQPKSAKLNAAVPLEVRGTLVKPTYALNKAAAVGRVGDLIGALTGKGTASSGGGAKTGKNISCFKTGGGKTATSKKKPARKPSVKDLKRDAKDIGKQLEKGLKGLFGR